MATKRGLGKGLDALIGTKPSKSKNRSTGDAPKGEVLLSVPVDAIETNPHQARKNFEETSLEELSRSILQSGMLQPVVATKATPGKYTLIAGERRLRAAKKAGLKKVPVRIVKAPDENSLAVLGLIENLHREDLDAIEEAEAFSKLAERFKMTQEKISKAVGKSRPYIANTLRLLDLPDKVLDMIRDGELTAGHGRAILRLSETAERITLAKRVIAKKLSVRETERLAEKLVSEKENTKITGQKGTHPFDWIADELKNQLGTKVEFAGQKEKGRLVIHYFSEEDLTRIIDLIKR